MIAIPSESAGERDGRRPRGHRDAAGRLRRGEDRRARQRPRPRRERPGRRRHRRPPRHGGRRRRRRRGRATPTSAICATASSTAAARRDQEAGIAAAVHGARIAKELGLLDGVQLWVTGTVMEEDCDGLCWQYILKEGVLKPDVVVITEPTNLGVYRGHRGPDGDGGPDAGPVVPRIGARARHQRRLQDGADRRRHRAAERAAGGRRRPVSRQGIGDDRRDPVHVAVAVRRGRQLHDPPGPPADPRRDAREGGGADRGARQRPAGRRDGDGPRLRPPSRTPASPTRRRSTTRPGSSRRNRRPSAPPSPPPTSALGRQPVVDKWTFSTNGVATCGMFGVPTVGFGPANEVHAHTPEDQCPVEHLTRAAQFYALFPQAFRSVDRR